MDDRITYEFMISGKEATVAEAIRYLKFLYALFALDDQESYWHKPPKADDCTMMTTTSFSTTRRRDVLAMTSCLKELSKEAHDLSVDFIEVSNMLPLGTKLIQLEQGRQRTMGHWPMPINDIREALTLRKLASANPSAADFDDAANAMIRYLRQSFFPAAGNAFGQVFADAIVLTCAKRQIRRRRTLMMAVVKSLEKVMTAIDDLNHRGWAVGKADSYRKLHSLHDSLAMELDCTVPLVAQRPAAQQARHIARISL